MENKLEVIQCLMENKIFAPSPSALAKELGYKGKMTLYRFVEGAVKPYTVDEVWEKLKAVNALEDEDLYKLGQVCRFAKEFYGVVLPEMNTDHPRWVENVVCSLVEGDFGYYSEEFRKDRAPRLMRIKEEDPDLFWGMVVLFYIKARKIDPYQKNFRKVQEDLLGSLDGLLFSLHPENGSAHQAVENLMAGLGQLTRKGNVWHLLYDNILLFRYYTEAGFLNTLVKGMPLLDLPAHSYWVVPGTPYREGEDAWVLLECDFNTQMNGLYLLFNLKAGKDIETFEVDLTCLFQFWPAGMEYPVLQTMRMVGAQKELCFYLYEYDAENRTLRFSEIPEWGNRHGLPGALRRIDFADPQGKEEKVWSRILDKFEKGVGRASCMKAAETFFSLEVLDDQYKIKEVTISRAFLSLLLEESGVDREYRLPMEAYSFLSQLTPLQQVMITRHKQDGEVYVEWPMLGYAVRLAEFHLTNSQ